MKDLNKIAEIIFKVLNSKASDNEHQILQKWRESSSNNENLYQRIRSKERIQSSFEIYDKINLDEAYKKVKPIKTPIKKISSVWFKYSAAILVVVLISNALIYFLKTSSPANNHLIKPGDHKALLITPDGAEYRLHDNTLKDIERDNLILHNDGQKLQYPQNYTAEAAPENEIHILSVPRGGEYELTLSDGTTIWLNSETTIKFPSYFEGDIREVELIGEAYFMVAHNTQMPFIVHTNEINIEVLGTEFNVKSYPYENGIATTLLNGKVKVFNENKTDDEHILTPGHQALFNKKNQVIEVNEVDAFSTAAWRFDRFVFRRESLGNIMNAIGRWYNVSVVYSEPELQSLKFNMNIYKYDEIEEMLAAIEKTGKVSFEQDHNIIIVKAE